MASTVKINLCKVCGTKMKGKVCAVCGSSEKTSKTIEVRAQQGEGKKTEKKKGK